MHQTTSFSEAKIYHEDKKIVVVVSKSGTRHRAKHFKRLREDYSDVVETTDGVKSNCDYVDHYEVCDTVTEAQASLLTRKI